MLRGIKILLSSINMIKYNKIYNLIAAKHYSNLFVINIMYYVSWSCAIIRSSFYLWTKILTRYLAISIQWFSIILGKDKWEETYCPRSHIQYYTRTTVSQLYVDIIYLSIFVCCKTKLDIYYRNVMIVHFQCGMRFYYDMTKRQIL